MREKRETKMDIDSNNLLIILSEYFSKKLNKKVEVKHNVKVKYESYGMYDDTEAVPDIEFFISEIANNGRVITTTTTYLDQNDLEEAIRDYVSSLGYEYEEVYFEGLEVKLRDKVMQRILK